MMHASYEEFLNTPLQVIQRDLQLASIENEARKQVQDARDAANKLK